MLTGISTGLEESSMVLTLLSRMSVGQRIRTHLLISSLDTTTLEHHLVISLFQKQSK